MRKAGAELQYAIGQSAIGKILVGVSEKGVCAVILGQTESEMVGELREGFPFFRLVSGNAETKKLLAKVIQCVEDPHRKIDFVIDEHGTPFQKKVWAAVRSIPPGKTASYAEVAAKIKAPRAYRAVATACKSNKFAIITPCHRVIRSDGTICGYRFGGILLKEELLQLEKTNC